VCLEVLAAGVCHWPVAAAAAAAAAAASAAAMCWLLAVDLAEFMEFRVALFLFIPVLVRWRLAVFA
jgi:hypothetical protein